MWYVCCVVRYVVRVLWCGVWAMVYMECVVCDACAVVRCVCCVMWCVYCGVVWAVSACCGVGACMRMYRVCVGLVQINHRNDTMFCN
ncbi:hypothetical protein CDAR_449681 [Caerostris darwini]|uniref:Secreted protein n=1 Tax=Caerostris darwini TaxID=1538125 RepID=A0AAV4QT24_9ARAC|nr:hypothetical protein CDAR_449681 [Caerostris darwini]